MQIDGGAGQAPQISGLAARDLSLQRVL